LSIIEESSIRTGKKMKILLVVIYRREYFKQS